jgi:hypothetical protein
VLLPYRLRHDYISGRRVAQFALDSRSVAVEVKKQRGRVVVKAIQIERLATPDRAVDLGGRRLERPASASGGFVARQVEKIENHQPRAQRDHRAASDATPSAAPGDLARSPSQQEGRGRP